jgi:hypothetical protein
MDSCITWHEIWYNDSSTLYCQSDVIMELQNINNEINLLAGARHLKIINEKLNKQSTGSLKYISMFQPARQKVTRKVNKYWHNK